MEVGTMDIIEVFELYPAQADCIAHLEEVRWHGKPRCVYCQSTNVTPAPKEQRHHCNNCNTTFSVTVGTIFHHTHLPLQKWFLAVTLVLNAKKGLSARQLSRDLKVNKDTAWRIGMKIRETMREQEQRTLLTGLVEMDEAYIGGKPRKSAPGDKSKRGRGTKKTPVVGMIERGGKVRAKVVKKGSLTMKNLTSLVRHNVDISNATLITDEFTGYLGIKYIMPHKTVDHSVWYVNGDIHTNNIESFWAILKRGIVGQYHKVSLRYLPKYIDEFSYRFNNRHHDNLFGLTINRAVGVR
jgi:transposase-like protein